MDGRSIPLFEVRRAAADGIVEKALEDFDAAHKCFTEQQTAIFDPVSNASVVSNAKQNLHPEKTLMHSSRSV